MAETVMERINSIKSWIRSLSDEKESLESTVKEFVQDKSIDLKVRWDLFAYSDCGERDSSYVNFKSLLNYSKKGNDSYRDTLLQDFVYDSIDRHQMMQVDMILERLEDSLKYADKQTYGTPITEYFDKDGVPFGRQGINEFKEECLQLFLKEFEFDW